MSQLQIEIFDLRDNQIEKGFHLLNLAIAHYTHGLTALYLDNCGLSSKSLVSLFEGFTKNPAMSITLEELSLSGNKFDDLSTDAFVTWLDKIKGLIDFSFSSSSFPFFSYCFYYLNLTGMLQVILV
jgi:Ran GTPase-activating protein (RanGAP) involved in mRNA processing and transport